MAQPEPEAEPAEEPEPDAFSISVAGVTGAESFAVRRGDTLGALQLRVAAKLRTPPDQQLLALEGKPLRAHLLDTCLLYTSPSPRDKRQSRMPSSA